MTRKRSQGAPSSAQGGAAPPHHQLPTERWTPLTCLVFRFSVLYLGLFCLATQISGSMLPNLSVYYRGMGRLPPMRGITAWTSERLFGIAPSLDDFSSGGEPLVFWVQTLWILIAAVAGTAIWSAMDRQRGSYVTLHKWFRVFVRFALAAALFEYGMTKVIPTQFPPPSLTTLVTPVGDLTLSALLWASIGASPVYEIFTGIVEVLGGVLLLFPRTVMLGALVSLGALIQVFALNMTYDVGLKLVSFHLIVLAVFLLVPDTTRLVDFFIRDRPAGRSAEPPLMRTRRGNRLALAAQIAFGAYLLAMYTYINVSFREVAGSGAPKSPLYGIWNVEQLSIDGEVRPPQLNDYDRRWRRVIFDAPGEVVFQRTDDSFARYGAAMGPGDRTLALTKGGSRNWAAHFSITRPSSDRLVVDGEMDGYRIRMQLQQVPFDTLRLLNSTFRWVRPHEQ